MSEGRRNDGSVAFEANGQTYRLVGDMNALADFEQAFDGLNAMKLLEGDLADLSVRHARGLFWAMLLEHQPNITIREAGRLFQFGMSAMQDAIKAAFPEIESENGSDVAEKPEASQPPR